VNPQPKSPPQQAVGFKRQLFVALGVIFLGVAYVGVVTPGFPTVIWLIVASYFFSRSSPRLHAWLMRSRLFGQLLRDWEQHRGMRVKSKIIAVSMMATACTCSIIFADVPDTVRYAIGACGTIGFVVIVFVLRTVRASTLIE